MSTNFYLHRSHRHGEVTEAPEHIGKRSGGWAFTFQGQNHESLAAWMVRLSTLGQQETIRDEYGMAYTLHEFLTAIEDTKRPWMLKGAEMAPMMKETDTAVGRRSWQSGGFNFSGYDFS